MATASVTYTFTNGTSADASEVNTNFTNIVSFLNNSVVHRDGSKAMTAAFDAGSFRVTNVATPTASGDAATKSYVDGLLTQAATAKFVRTTNISVSAGASGSVTFETETNDADGWWSSGTTLTCPATGVYAVSVYVKKASGSGSVRVEFDPDDASDTTLVSYSTNSNATSEAGAGQILYLTSGDTFTVEYFETTVTDSAVIDTVILTITKLAVI